ncbi:hypothetical protein E1262_01795 [Jiangella aurantiaca]|uniref:Uncharacterized protein n=1 Tax=Jiangella aurantiaca TaxID=2530373 RepID=A0A4R5AM61_9ACTN|nr:hypothetical protein [Jiangella aurantiaca]TDD72619.1 hypothetical protein E1262_01795 [Jiangella aurantiaca]
MRGLVIVQPDGPPDERARPRFVQRPGLRRLAQDPGNGVIELAHGGFVIGHQIDLHHAQKAGAAAERSDHADLLPSIDNRGQACQNA